MELKSLRDKKGWSSKEVCTQEANSARKSLLKKRPGCALYSTCTDNRAKKGAHGLRKFECSFYPSRIAQTSSQAIAVSTARREKLSKKQNPAFLSERLSSAERLERRIQYFRDNPDLLKRLHTAQASKKRNNNSLCNQRLRKLAINYSEENRLNHFKQLVLIRERRRFQATKKRDSLEKRRKSTLIKSINRRQNMKEENANKKKNMKRIYGSCKILFLMSRLQTITARFYEICLEIRRRNILQFNVLMIQKAWKLNKATENGRKYRNAILKVRAFVVSAKVNLKYKRRRRYANIIHWVLAEIETSNFQNVVKNYRHKVVKCQNLYRSYVKITKFRLKALCMVFNRYESEIIKQEQKADFELKIEQEVKAAQDIYGVDELKNILNKILSQDTRKLVLSHIGNNISSRYSVQISERLNVLRGLKVVKMALNGEQLNKYNDKNNKLSNIDQENTRTLENWDRPLKLPNNVNRDLIFKMMFQNIHRYIYQRHLFSIKQTRNFVTSVESESASKLSKSNDIAKTNKKVSNKLKLKILAKYLKTMRTTFKQEYSRVKKEQMYARTTKKKFTSDDIKEIIRANTEKATRYLLSKKFNLIEIHKGRESQKQNIFQSNLFVRIYSVWDFDYQRNIFKTLVYKAREVGSGDISNILSPKGQQLVLPFTNPEGAITKSINSRSDSFKFFIGDNDGDSVLTRS